MIPIDEALGHIESQVKQLPTEKVSLLNIPGRVLATTVRSDIDSPPHDKSMMDGFAVKSSDLESGIRQFKVTQTIPAGTWPSSKVENGEAARIMTGAPMPEGADTVVMIELATIQNHSDDSDSESVQLDIEESPPGKYMMKRAANIRVGQPVFEVGHRFRATDVGLLAETGAFEVEVFRVPEIAVLPTGDELVDCREVPQQAQIRNSNGPLLEAMVTDLGFPVNYLGVGRDNRDELKSLVSRGLKSDVLLLSGGVSMGQFDLVPGVLAEAGVETVFHKVAIKPGKPIWFGVLRKNENERDTYVFGLPGNPVSSLVGFQVFVRSAIRKLTGAMTFAPHTLSAKLHSPHEARGNRPTYWPGKWVANGSVEREVESLEWRGSSDLVALGEAEVLIYFEAGTQTHPAGKVVQVLPL